MRSILGRFFWQHGPGWVGGAAWGSVSSISAWKTLAMTSLSPPALRHPRRSEKQERGAEASSSPIQMVSTTLGPSACSGEVQTGSFSELRQPLAIITRFLAQPLGHVRPAQRGG